MARRRHPSNLGHDPRHQTRTGPESLRWFWALHAPSKPGEMRTSNQVATMDEAKAELEASWKRWKAWAKMEEMP